MARITGQVVSVTDHGDLVTDIRIDDLDDAPRDDRLIVQFDGHTTLGLYESTHSHPPMTLVAFLNESGLIQLTITDGDLSGFLGIKTGTSVDVNWKSG